MNDRELLEYAARASGDKIIGWTLDKNGVEVAITENDHYWQPLNKSLLTDCMGDALRLAVKLGLILEIKDLFLDTDYWVKRKVYVRHHFIDENEEGWIIVFPVEVENKDPYSATRRAIVLTAAEIGRLNHEFNNL